MTKQSFAIARAVGVIGATVALVSGITFANLTSNAVTLTANQLATATAALQVKSAAEAFGTTGTGFNFTGLLPGLESPTPFHFSLKNNGTSPLVLSVTIPNIAGTLVGITADKVHLKIAADGFPSPLDGTLADYNNQTFTLPGGTLIGGLTQNYTVTATIDPSYIGSGASLPGFTMTFTGTQPNPVSAS